VNDQAKTCCQQLSEHELFLGNSAFVALSDIRTEIKPVRIDPSDHSWRDL